ncbi:DUF2913 family protein [Salmonella enterica subsp. enterica serovar Enteritidis]|nr:DUF2913 family protein [Salmonella enterica subsp. enterica serovar Enteritidis]
MEQTELFRLTWGLETAKSQQWVYHVLSDTEWLRLRRQSLNPDICAVYIPKSVLEKAFSEEGKQTMPVPVRITGNMEAFGVLLTSCGWLIRPSPEPDVLFLQAK